MLRAEDRIRLQHMLDAARKAQAMIVGRDREDLNDDEQLSLALQRLVEIIGEAAKQVTAETQARGASIPWQAIAGMRDRLIHAYWDVNLDILWDTVTDDLPPLIDGLESLLNLSAPPG
jgi:uncharacterized protein with HEPN domain